MWAVFCADCTNMAKLHKIAGGYTAQFVHIAQNGCSIAFVHIAQNGGERVFDFCAICTVLVD